MKEVFYVIYTTSTVYEQECPTYLMLLNEGHMLQGSLYDATKYTKKGNAEKEISITSNIFKDKAFEIIDVDRRIFGEHPKHVKD